MPATPGPRPPGPAAASLADWRVERVWSWAATQREQHERIAHARLVGLSLMAVRYFMIDWVREDVAAGQVGLRLVMEDARLSVV